MRVLSWLRDQGKLNASQYESVLRKAQLGGERIEEALLDTNVFHEGELLKLLAVLYQTRFVSTDRLEKADIDQRTLERIPQKIAERLQVFPVVFDPRTNLLSVVVAAPGEDDIEKQVQVVSGVREVRAYVARPAAIRAAIEKFYRGRARAFAELRAREVPELELHEPSPLGGASDVAMNGFDDPFLSIVGPAESRRASSRPPPKLETARPSTVPVVTDAVFVDPEAYLETLAVFVSLLEQDRGELRGHSIQVARLCRLVAERVGLSLGDRHSLLTAAYLHDVGKPSEHHLTALNVARYEAHRAVAEKSQTAPVKLFSTALPEPARRILGHLYERFDGQGFPDRLAGKDIPYGSRVLSIVETYCDLTGHTDNPYGQLLTTAQALSVLKDLSPSLFDPTLVDLLRIVVAGDAGSESLAGRTRALLVDPDPEETTVLELRLIEYGFTVRVARDLAGARTALRDGSDVVITEVDLVSEGEGFELLRAIAELGDARPSVLVLTRRADRDSVGKGFELGAADYLVKPASPEVVAKKAAQAVEGAARQHATGVSGSLKDMSVPDVVQILANGRRGGKLSIISGGKRGEILFSDGQIHDASFGSLAGEEAFYAILKLAEGTFSLDPTFAPQKRAIHASTEGLLLEGMRRLDEGLV